MKRLSLITALAITIFCSFHIDNTRLHKVVVGRSVRMADTTKDLPRSYKQRKFMNDVSGISTDILMIPGNIVSFHPKDTSYEFHSPHGIIKGNKLPVSTAIEDGMIYGGLITPNTSFNGSYLIGGLHADKNEVMEIAIKDEVISKVPDSLVDIDAIKMAVKGIPAEELKNLFYVKAATLSIIESKKYTLSKFDITKNAFYITWNGKTYSTNEKIIVDKVVSMFLIPLDRLAN
jgi:hypothetical protein